MVHPGHSGTDPHLWGEVSALYEMKLKKYGHHKSDLYNASRIFLVLINIFQQKESALYPSICEGISMRFEVKEKY